MCHRHRLSLFLCALLLAISLSALAPASVQALDPADCPGSTGIPSDQCQALVALYNGTGGDNWDNTVGGTSVWDTSSPATGWFGITLIGGDVTTIDLSSNNLFGSIPDLSDLTALTTLYLNDNLLTGTLPATLNATDMPALTALLLRYNCRLAAYDSAQETWIESLDADWDTLSASCPNMGASPPANPAEQQPSIAQEEASAPPFGDPVPCSSILFVDGWGIYAEGTPGGTAFTVPKAPDGYTYLADPAYDGYCDVFTISSEHSPLPVQVCWPASVNVTVGLYHDQADLSRTWAILPSTHKENSVCASLPALGGVALLADRTASGVAGTTGESSTNVSVPVEESSPPLISAMANPLTNPCTLTITNRVNFRESPDGAIIQTTAGIDHRIPYQTTLTTTAQADGWYQVEYLGQSGWISGDYVTANCQ